MGSQPDTCPHRANDHGMGCGWKSVVAKWHWSMYSLPLVLVVFLGAIQVLVPADLADKVQPTPAAAVNLSSFARALVQIVGASVVYCFVCLTAISYFARETHAILKSTDTEATNRLVMCHFAVLCFFAIGLCVLYVCCPSVLVASRVTFEPTLGTYEYTMNVGFKKIHGQLLTLVPSVLGSVTGIVSILHAASATRRAILVYCKTIVGDRNATDDTGNPLLGGMMVLALVLVASVLLVSFHVHAHGAFFGRASHEEFATFVSVFWGVGLSVVAAAVYVPHLVVLGWVRRRDPVRRGTETGRAVIVERTEMTLSILGPLFAVFVSWVIENLLRNSTG